MDGFYRIDPDLPKVVTLEPLSLRPREAAAALGISEKSLERLKKAGKIQALKIPSPVAKKRGGGSITVYELDELRAYLKSLREAAGRAGA